MPSASSLPAILAWPLLAVAASGCLLWLVVNARVHALCRRRPTVRAGLAVAPPENGWPTVSVVVPAHNEAGTIDACAASLRAVRYPRLEIIFVLDRCTDDTASIIARHAEADPRVVAVENDACPEGWAGKCHAAALGAARAGGEYVLFTDADTAFEPDLVRAAVALARDRDLALLSVLSTLTLDRAHERIAQPVASMNLMRIYPISHVNRRHRPRPFANGQFMLFERSRYEEIGGHAAVRDDLLEDLAFARAVHAAGGAGGIFLADGMLRCSMYDSMEAFRRGWKRIFIEACHRRPRRLRRYGRRILAEGVVLPLVQAAAVLVGIALLAQGDRPFGVALLATVAVGVIAQAVALVRIYALGGAPAVMVAQYPRGCWIVGRIMLEAARDLADGRPIIWGGREYVLEPRP